MPRFKNVRIKMANGKSRLQRAQILRSGKLKFVKNKARSAVRHTKHAARRIKHRVTRRRPSKSPVSRKASKPRSKSMVFGGIKKTLNQPIIKKVLMAAGLVSVAISILSLVSPRAAGAVSTPTGKAALGFVAGDFVGAISNFLIGGGLPQITGALSGGGGSGNTAVQGSAGFA